MEMGSLEGLVQTDSRALHKLGRKGSRIQSSFHCGFEQIQVEVETEQQGLKSLEIFLNVGRELGSFIS